MAPTAAASAAADPDMPAKNMADTMVTAASPPGSQPTRALAKSMIRRLMPPVSMMMPANMKSGTAMRWKESTPPEHPLHHHHQGKGPLDQNADDRRRADGDGDGRVDRKERE